jgi:hypothetical protein
MEGVCKLFHHADYFEIPVWGKLIHPLYSTFYLKILH